MDAKNIGRKVVGVFCILGGIIIFIGLGMRLTGYLPVRTGDDMCITILSPIAGIVAFIVGIYLLRTDAD
jgi:hypothetical protein